MVGIWLGAHAPERISSLTLCCTSAKPGNDQSWADRADTVVEEGSVETVADAIVARWVTPEYAQENPEVDEGLRSMLAGAAPSGYAACCRVISGLDLLTELGQITAPTLVISGAQDEALAPEHQRALPASVAGARLETIDPGAHMPNVERPQVFTDLLAKHIQEHSG